MNIPKKVKTNSKARKSLRILSVFLGLFLLFLFIPCPRFQNPFSTVLLDTDGSLLGAHIASDEQWRFPPPEELSEKYKTALLCFEDNYFFYHPGINPVALSRALVQNIRAGHVVSGGSTISMQVARMSGHAPRTLINKLWEMLKALRLEMTLRKDDILLMYAANAPFGGNIVGIETASWHYFERPPKHLTWAESALLAVLPNAPAQLRPGTNGELLKQKRDKLLHILHKKQHIDSTELFLSLLEPLPEGPRQLSGEAPHLVDYILKTAPGQSVTTTLRRDIQLKAAQTLQRHSERMAGNHIHHAGAIIVEIESGNVVAYIGNSRSGDYTKGHSVDMVRARRSSGSILKPFLYTSALQDGTICPRCFYPMSQPNTKTMPQGIFIAVSMALFPPPKHCPDHLTSHL
jgi:penicillin-binding protein 1C